MNKARDALRSEAQIEADAEETAAATKEISSDYGKFKLRPLAQTEAEVAHRCRLLDKIVKARGDPGQYTTLQQVWSDATLGRVDAKCLVDSICDLYGELWSNSYMLAELIAVIPHSALRLGMLKYILVDRKRERESGESGRVARVARGRG